MFPHAALRMSAPRKPYAPTDLAPIANECVPRAGSSDHTVIDVLTVSIAVPRLTRLALLFVAA
jgi:hypothetical protein